MSGPVKAGLYPQSEEKDILVVAMAEEIKIDLNLTNVCHGCLSDDRTVTALGDMAEIMLCVLSVHRPCLVYGIEDTKVCWECMVTLKKFKTFQHQVRKAQAGLKHLVYEAGSHPRTLSKLTIVKKHYYDLEIKHYAHKKLKKKTEPLETITIIKQESENIHSYSDDDRLDDVNGDIDIKNDDDDKDDVDVKNADTELETVAFGIKSQETVDDDTRIDDVKDFSGITKDEVDFSYVKEELQQEVKVKKPRRRKDTKCVNNVVGYYKRYATLVKTEKKDWGSWETVRGHFESVQFSEKEMEDHFFTKDRRNTSYHRLPHKCNICTLGYTKEDDLKRHNDLNHHKEGAPYKCTLCYKKQASADALEKHWRLHSLVFRCKMCLDVCKENFIRKHLDHAHTKTYDCNVCHMKFGTLKTFTLHYKEMHMTYVCDYCNYTLTTKKKMEKHISEHHMTYVCKDCDRTYKNYIYYKKHCYALHPHTLKLKINPELSFCVECNKQFPSVDKYKTHLRVSSRHNKKKNICLPCPDCGKIFGRKKNLTYHYNLFHLKKTNFYCEICDKYFARPSGLRTHRANVHLKVEKVKDKICDLCGRGFASHVVLRHHRRTHTGERPHKCPHCSAEFIQKYAMQTHVRTQHKEFGKDDRAPTQAATQYKKANVPLWPEAGYFV